MEKNNKKFIMPSKLNDNVTEIVILKKIKKIKKKRKIGFPCIFYGMEFRRIFKFNLNEISSEQYEIKFKNPQNILPTPHISKAIPKTQMQGKIS